MLQYNTMRFGTDEMSFSKQALLISKAPFDATGETSITGFELEGGQPDGSTRKVLFKVDNALYKFSGDELTAVSGSEDIETVLNEGNTVDELASVSDIPDWVGKKIYPLIALTSPADANTFPSLKIGLKVMSSSDVYEKITETSEIQLTNSEGERPRISDVQVTGTTTGNASYTVTARVKNNDAWGEYIPVQNVRDVDADAIRFRIRYNVNVIGGNDSAKVSKILIHYTGGTSAVAGDVAEIFSVMRDYQYPLGTCAVSIRHKQLIDSKILAFVNFARQPKTRTFLHLGVSDGTRQTFILGENGVRDTGIDQSTLKVFVDAQQLLSFSYNTEVSELEVQVDPGKAISVSYDYDRDAENWREMTADVVQEPYDDGTFLTRFMCSLDDDELDNQTVTNIRIKLERTSGTVVDEVLGIATGTSQQFVLAHAAVAETLSLNAAFTYDADSQIVTCVAPAGTEIKANYDWLGETHTVYSWAAAWSPAI